MSQSSVCPEANLSIAKETTRLAFDCDGKMYYGFHHFVNKEALQPGDQIVMFWFDGDLDLWVIDCPEGMNQIKQYYADEWPDWEKRTDWLILDQAP